MCSSRNIPFEPKKVAVEIILVLKKYEFYQKKYFRQNMSIQYVYTGAYIRTATLFGPLRTDDKFLVIFRAGDNFLQFFRTGDTFFSIQDG